MLMAMAVISLVVGGVAMAEEDQVLLFAEGKLPAQMQQNHTKAVLVTHDGQSAMKVDFLVTDWPNVFFTPQEGVWDWSTSAGLAVDLHNPTTETVTVCMRVDNAGGDGLTNCKTATGMVPPGGDATVECRFGTKDTEGFWGMRGVPILGPVPTGPALDPSRITAFQVFLPQPGKPHTLLLKAARLFGRGGDLSKLVPMPFVDRFGQCKHDDWPGKLKDEASLQTRRQAEERAWQDAPQLPDRDQYGGWTEGPKLEATGWFRTEQVDGKWWLVTPEGHLFFSVGVDCVGTWERTFVEDRESWFEWLPGRDEEPYKGLFSQVSGAHSMADTIGGKGTTFGFYCANLIRKYGDRWQEKWRDSVYHRLRNWGFNTVANWSQADVLQNSTLPFVVSLGIGGTVREIEGARGYWGRMKDVFAPSFAEAVERSIAGGAKPWAANPLCLGYFVDNEISWETVHKGTLASPVEQPCRLALVDRLRRAYETIAKLNDAWGTDAADWEALRAPGSENEACKRDLDGFEYAFALRYFDTINQALKKHAPNQLYLGCRFSSAPPNAVRACAAAADVVSFNRYERQIDCTKYTGSNDLGKPVIIGEFHFGALDRGMFHTGLVATQDQAERAQCYADYVRAVADCPAFVGCHWFQFVDEPITGRWFDGENYNIGFLDVTDTPYPELVAAARRVHGEVYGRRYR